jgi:hypothetical protein
MKTAIILASGPSLTAEQIEAARQSGHFTIVVNSTFKVFPDADALYSGDYLWWKVNMAEARRMFKGKLWTQDSSAAARWPDLHRVRGCNREGLGREIIHQNGHSGAQALNLAFLWGYDRIVLLGFDMKLGPAGEKHHHADHPAPLVQSQTFGEWLHKFEKIARDFKTTKCEVFNATPGSALKCFPSVEWRDVL